MKTIQFYAMLLITAMGCQSGGGDEKSLAGTHPKLEEQLKTKTVETPISSNENPELYQRYQLSFTGTDSAARSFRVEEMYEGKLTSPDFSAHNHLQQHKAAIQQGLKAGINFAGRYTVVTVACGTNCQEHYIVNRETGQVLDKVQSGLGAGFSADSRLFILNPPDSTINYNACDLCAPKTFVLEDGQLKETGIK
ncbi:hypothetical protein FVR03_16210 [Pontibacter qinzhouensis]|uniref:Lipoprotein n=1 Tax=Pontibacter qinzhouensis TaxID=2603253 RepID=A0A5C8JI25_9BACT|nr:hypothetical protein [Pontibacter qinzhouensis]TXK37021.1 hypothetical protein FVR03_16210 [Pontibacter qinzhouensis]